MALAAISVRRRFARDSHGFDAALRRRGAARGAPRRSREAGAASVSDGRGNSPGSQTARESPPRSRQPSLEAPDATGREKASQSGFYLLGAAAL